MPVLLAETLAVLDLGPGLVVVDGTVGAAGHARAIAQAIGPDGLVLGLDRDSEILAFSRAALAQAAKDAPGQARVSLHHLSYSRMQEALAADGQAACDRVLLDLGVSSLQLDAAVRGFSFMADGPLDMRMDATSGPTAADWLRSASEVEIADALFQLGDERYSRRIARAVVERRRRAPLQRTGELAELIVRALPPAARRGRIHPATRSFQAIRMVVNDELGELQRGLDAAVRCLRPGGRLAVIAFHSAEDRVVKQFLRAHTIVVTKKPITAADAEVRRNPRSRSARLRCGIVRDGASSLDGGTAHDGGLDRDEPNARDGGNAPDGRNARADRNARDGGNARDDGFDPDDRNARDGGFARADGNARGNGNARDEGIARDNGDARDDGGGA